MKQLIYIAILVIFTGCTGERLLTGIFTFKPDLSCKIALENCEFTDSISTTLTDTTFIHDTTRQVRLPEIDTATYGRYLWWWDSLTNSTRHPNEFISDTVYLETGVGTASTYIDSGHQRLGFKTLDSLKTKIREFRSRTKVITERYQISLANVRYKEKQLNVVHNKFLQAEQAKKTWRVVALIFIFVTLGGIFVVLFWS